MQLLVLLSLAVAVAASPLDAAKRTTTITSTVTPTCGLPADTTRTTTSATKVNDDDSVSTITKVVTGAFSTPSLFNIYATINDRYAIHTVEALGLTGTTGYDPPRFAMASGNRLRYGKNQFAEQDNTTDPEDFFFNTPASIKKSNEGYITCDITYAGDGICPLNCVSPYGNGTVSSMGYGNVWYLGTTAIAYGEPGDDFQIFTAIVVS